MLFEIFCLFGKDYDRNGALAAKGLPRVCFIRDFIKKQCGHVQEYGMFVLEISVARFIYLFLILSETHVDSWILNHRNQLVENYSGKRVILKLKKFFDNWKC